MGRTKSRDFRAECGSNDRRSPWSGGGRAMLRQAHLKTVSVVTEL
jgi:hypothetical protein